MRTIARILVLLIMMAPTQSKAQQDWGDDTVEVIRFKHKIDVNLPNHINVTLHLKELDSWNQARAIRDYKGVIVKHIDYLKDSLSKYPLNTNILTINQFQEYDKIHFASIPNQETEFVYKGGIYYALKQTIDTLNIFERNAAPNPQQNIEIQYTFTAKSLADLTTINEKHINQLLTHIDSTVNVAKQKTKNSKAYFYQTKSKIEITDNGESSVTLKETKPFRGALRNLTFGIGFGAIVHQNTISPLSEFTVGFIMDRTIKSAFFLGMNASTFFDITDKSNFNNNISYSNVTLEIGSIKNQIGFMQNKTSIGFGVLVRKPINTSIFKETTFCLPSMHLNFAISNMISTSLMIASDFKMKPKNQFIGITLKYNL